MSNPNPRNSFVVDALPNDDPELIELEHLKKVRADIQKRRKAAKQKNFDTKHPGVKAVRESVYASQATPGTKTGEKIKLVIAKEPIPEEIVHTERSEPKPVEPVKAPEPEKKEEPKPQFELGGKPLNVTLPAPVVQPPSVVRPVNNKWF